MIYGGSQLVLLTLELKQFSASLGIKIGYVYMIIPISGVLITIYALDFIRATLAGEVYIPPHLQNDDDSIVTGE
jgi:TRAP-type C4-dicarboxylate transport system permease small subunit